LVPERGELSPYLGGVAGRWIPDDPNPLLTQNPCALVMSCSISNFVDSISEFVAAIWVTKSSASESIVNPGDSLPKGLREPCRSDIRMDPDDLPERFSPDLFAFGVTERDMEDTTVR
jgi:hypothetical protein